MKEKFKKVQKKSMEKHKRKIREREREKPCVINL